jgi:class 3 adenylate cyclase/YHS domain-containing protein
MKKIKQQGEQDMAILFADLSGYTALTETHGPVIAADLIDAYSRLVKESLVGSSKLHQRSGDEMMIVSPSPDDLFKTAVRMIQKSSVENNFLQIHGGMHFGKVLFRGGHYFGAAVNEASRIASVAGKGTFLCSDIIADALHDRGAFKLLSHGRESFKNVSGEKYLFELIVKDKQPYTIDPVCRMLILDQKKAVPLQGHDIFFCSDECLDVYNSSAITGNIAV